MRLTRIPNSVMFSLDLKNRAILITLLHLIDHFTPQLRNVIQHEQQHNTT